MGWRRLEILYCAVHVLLQQRGQLEIHPSSHVHQLWGILHKSITFYNLLYSLFYSLMCCRSSCRPYLLSLETTSSVSCSSPSFGTSMTAETRSLCSSPSFGSFPNSQAPLLFSSRYSGSCEIHTCSCQCYGPTTAQRGEDGSGSSFSGSRQPGTGQIMFCSRSCGSSMAAGAANPFVCSRLSSTSGAASTRQQYSSSPSTTTARLMQPRTPFWVSSGTRTEPIKTIFISSRCTCSGTTRDALSLSLLLFGTSERNPTLSSAFSHSFGYCIFKSEEYCYFFDGMAAKAAIL